MINITTINILSILGLGFVDPLACHVRERAQSNLGEP